jgi:hypothetical protein
MNEEAIDDWFLVFNATFNNVYIVATSFNGGKSRSTRKYTFVNMYFKKINTIRLHNFSYY